MTVTVKNPKTGAAVALDVVLPDLSVRQDIMLSMSEADGIMPRLRLAAALVALCVPEVARALGAARSLIYRDLYAYGDRALAELRDRAWPDEEIWSASSQLVPIVSDNLWPSKDEVTAAVGN